MNILEARKELKTKSIFDMELRVTYYARVSSESDRQLNSLDNQIFYYENLIRQNPKWSFVPGYIDEGLSAATTKKRENFNRMIEDANKGMFDLVITKEISRFARNTLDSIRYTRQLLSDGVGVFFQNDSLNTLDEDSELRLSIMSSIAQDELRKLSSRVQFGHQQAIKQGVVLGNSRIFGYRKDNKRLVLDETQAPMVRELFQLYATGTYSLRQLEKYFWEKGYRNYNGNKIAHSTLANIIANPKYKGFYVGNKVRVVDLFTKKQIFLPEEEWVQYKDESGEIVPAIVSEELWEKANAVLKKRSEDVKGRKGICNHTNLLTGKLFCAHCGAPYYRHDSVDRRGNKNSRWVCSGKKKNGYSSCPSFPLYEAEIKPLLLELFEEAAPHVEDMIEEYLEMFRGVLQSDSPAKRIEELNRQINLVLKKQQQLLTYNVAGQITNRDFLNMNTACGREMEALQKELDELTAQQDSMAQFQKQMDAIRATASAAQKDAESGLINREFVEQFIDVIYAETVDDKTVCLRVKLFSGETTAKYLHRLRVRSAARPSEGAKKAAAGAESAAVPTGQMVKKMIESYEKNL